MRSLSARDGTSTDWPSWRTLWPGRSRTASRYESVATSRSPSASAVTSTPVRIGRASSPEAAGTTWRRAAASSPASSVTPSAPARGGGGTRRRETPAARTPSAEAVMRACSPSTSTSTAPLGSDLHDIGRPGARAGRRPRPRAVHAVADRHRDRQLEVVAGERQRVTLELGADPGQDRQCTAAAGGGPSRGAERLDEDVSLASELHVALFLCTVGMNPTRSSSRGCGLWMTERRRRSAARSPSPCRPQAPTAGRVHA